MSKKATKHTNKQPDITKDVMNKVRGGEVKMHSHHYFVLLSVLTAVGLLATTVCAIYFVHITTFSLRSRATLDYLGYGPSGMAHFVRVFPWPWLVLAASSLAAVGYLLRHYDLPYKHHFKAVALGAALVLVLVGFVTASADIALPGRPVPPGPMMQPRQATDRARLVGKIEDVEDDMFVLDEDEGDEVEVRYDKKTIKRTEITTDQEVMVLGVWEGEHFKAHAIGPTRPRGHRPF